uniref:Uncharacterized protein n=1 Tax=Rhodococcus sp. NS1 TaxID=402236 RepID=A0A097SQ64_9NOCA|nr:hypothetical protein LRS1606.232 [Rhodococcus sp. NS1]
MHGGCSDQLRVHRHRLRILLGPRLRWTRHRSDGVLGYGPMWRTRRRRRSKHTHRREPRSADGRSVDEHENGTSSERPCGGYPLVPGRAEQTGKLDPKGDSGELTGYPAKRFVLLSSSVGLGIS